MAIVLAVKARDKMIVDLIELVILEEGMMDQSSKSVMSGNAAGRWKCLKR